MIKIEVNNAVSTIKDIPSDIEQLLKKELRYVDQNVNYSYNKNLKEIQYLEDMLKDNSVRVNQDTIYGKIKKLTAINKKLVKDLYVMLYEAGNFGTGLLPKVTRVLDSASISYELNDLRIKPTTNLKYVLKQSFPPLRYYQRAAANAIKSTGRGIIVSGTGTGKSLTMSRMIWDLGVKTVILVPNKALVDNMYDTLIKYFGKGQVERLTTKSKKTKNINVVNIQALVRLDPKLFTDIEACFIDEFHHSASTTFLEANEKHLKNCYFRVGLTATNWRHDGSDLALESVLSEVVYDYTIEQALKDGFLVKPTFHIEETELSEGSNYQDEYTTQIAENKGRNDLIVDIARHHAKDSTLILVQRVEHGEKLQSLLPGSGFIHGEENDTIRQNMMDDFRSGKLKCLIGTSGTMSEGVDLPRANVLIQAGGGKAKGGVMQQVGRILRPFEGKTEAHVYDFTDTGSKWLSKHSFERQEIYKMYDVDLTEGAENE